MSESTETIKQKVIQKYDNEAIEKDNLDWLKRGGNERVPESRTAHYFIERKVNEALIMYEQNISSSTKALEIGCSFGHMTALLAKKFSSLTAVDISPESVKIAENRLKHYGINNVNFVVDDAEILSSLPDNSFDIIFSFSTIRFCPNPQDAINSIYKKLKRGGIAIIDFPNKYSPWHIFVKKMVGVEKHIFDNLYSPSDVKDLFVNAGFTVETTKIFLFTSKRIPSSFLFLSKTIDFVLERLPFMKRFAGIIMIKGTKK